MAQRSHWYGRHGPKWPSFRRHDAGWQARGLVLWAPQPLTHALVAGAFVPDLSARRQHGSSVGTTSVSPAGPFACPVFVNAASSGVGFGNTRNITAAITLSMWVRTAGPLVTWAKGINKGNERSYSLQTNDNGTGPSMRISATTSGAVQAGVSIADGVPHLVTGTYDSSITRIYVDGVQRGSTTAATGPISVVPDHVGIGFDSTFLGDAYEGEWWDARIYDRALSEREVYQLFDPQTRFDLFRPRTAAPVFAFVPPAGGVSLAPDAILASTNLSGAVTDIDDDPDAAGTDWLTATDPLASTDLRVSFPTPGSS